MKHPLISLVLALSAAASFAQTTAPAAIAPVDGEVRKVDMGAKKVTIRHGDIKNLDMPAMTMVFQVADPSALEKIKPGDKVRFKAERGTGGALIASDIQPIGQ